MLAVLLTPLGLAFVPLPVASPAPEAHFCTDRACRLLCRLSGKQGCDHQHHAPSDHAAHGGAAVAASPGIGATVGCPRDRQAPARVEAHADLRSLLIVAPALGAPPAHDDLEFLPPLPGITAHDREPPTPPPRPGSLSGWAAASSSSA